MHTYYFEKLEVWKEAKAFAVEIYKITGGFPENEKYGMTNQVRRATLSISANIAEGMARRTPKDKQKFLNQAYSSAIEVLSFLIIAKDLSFLNEENYLQLREKIEKITNQIAALARAVS